MKNRIYKIKDKILVQGNENELTKDEILVKEENGSIVLKERVNGEVKSITGGKSEKITNVTVSGQNTITTSSLANDVLQTDLTFDNLKDSTSINLMLMGENKQFDFFNTFEQPGPDSSILTGYLFINYSSVISFLNIITDSNNNILAVTYAYPVN